MSGDGRVLMRLRCCIDNVMRNCTWSVLVIIPQRRLGEGKGEGATRGEADIAPLPGNGNFADGRPTVLGNEGDGRGATVGCHAEGKAAAAGGDTSGRGGGLKAGSVTADGLPVVEAGEVDAVKDGRDTEPAGVTEGCGAPLLATSHHEAGARTAAAAVV